MSTEGVAKPILCVDFDGVIHSYTSPWQGPLVIPDPPVPGALAFLAEATRHFRVCIFSSRSHEPGGIDAMKAKLWEWGLDDDWIRGLDDYWIRGLDDYWINRIEWPLTKPPFAVALDDRVLTFEGKFPSMETLRKFKPWNKKEPLSGLRKMPEGSTIE